MKHGPTLLVNYRFLSPFPTGDKWKEAFDRVRKSTELDVAIDLGNAIAAFEVHNEVIRLYFKVPSTKPVTDAPKDQDDLTKDVKNILGMI